MSGSDKDMELLKSDKCNVPIRRNSVAGNIDKFSGKIPMKTSDIESLNKVLKTIESMNNKEQENSITLRRIEEKVDRCLEENARININLMMMSNSSNVESAREMAERNKNGLIILINALKEVAKSPPNPIPQPVNPPSISLENERPTVTISENPTTQRNVENRVNNPINNARTYSHIVATEKKDFNKVATQESVEEARP